MTSKPAHNSEDNTSKAQSDGFSSMQFFGILQLAIFIPFIGPITTILLALLNKQKQGSKSLLWAGIGMLVLHAGVLVTFLSLNSAE